MNKIKSSGLVLRQGKNNYRQQGGSMWSFLFNCGLLLFIAYLGMMLGPAYFENSAVKKAVDASIAQFSAPAQINKRDMIKSIDDRLYIDGISGVDVKNSLDVKKDKGSATVSFNYEKKIPLFYNINVLLDFPHTVIK